MLWMAAMMALAAPQASPQKTTHFPEDWDVVESDEGCAISREYLDNSQFVVAYYPAESTIVFYDPKFTWVKDGELYWLRLLATDPSGKNRLQGMVGAIGQAATREVGPSLRIRLPTDRVRDLLANNLAFGGFQQHSQLFGVSLDNVAAPLSALQTCAATLAKRHGDPTATSPLPRVPIPWSKDSN
jgi:hypothetical protein